MSEPELEEPFIKMPIRDLIERIDGRVRTLEQSAARQATVRWSVFLSVVSGPGAAILTYVLTHK